MKVLDHPYFYSRLMKFLGADRQELDQYIKPKKGDKILDIGCGPADILLNLPSDIEYTGIDFNERYIKSAQEKFGEKGVFIVGDIADYDLSFKESFDLVLSLGVIHHLPDQHAIKLLNDGYRCLKEGGKLVTLDNVKGDWIGVINKIALYLDRGKFIRDKNEYLALFSKFPDVKCNVIRSNLIIPYYYIICEITKNSQKNI
ncbi:MAG: class I SAM-dependent methyltransferase [Methanomicrobiaceae archaeon]|nr:class I SAM-dependent methyltransferase [Methanomicrobiaceae archaeon]